MLERPNPLGAPGEPNLLRQGILRLRRLLAQVADIVTLRTDTITERTSAAGVTIDGALIKDLALKIDTITESTGNAGVTIENVKFENGTLVGNLVFDQARQITTASGDLSISPAADVDFEGNKLKDIGELIFTKSTITISSDEIGTVPGSTWVYLTGQGGANDDLKGIAAGSEGQLLILTPTAGDDITLKHNAAVGEKPLLINGEADVTLGEDHDIAFAIYDAAATAWNVLVPVSGGDGVGTVEPINFIIDGGGSVITTGEKGHVLIEYACTINQVTLLADQSGSIVVDIWKDTYANFPPADADSITASAVPTISTATKSQDSTLTGWTTSISAGDILTFNVDSITTCERVSVVLKVTRT